MLQVKSFKFSDEDAINTLLKTHRIAPGAGIFVSNSEIIIPYEDGLPMNVAQQIIQAKEERNKKITQLATINFAQSLLNKQVDIARKQLEQLESSTMVIPGTKEAYDQQKDIDIKIKQLKNVIEQFNVNIHSNQAEIDRVNVEIELYEDMIADFNDFG